MESFLHNFDGILFSSFCRKEKKNAGTICFKLMINKIPSKLCWKDSIKKLMEVTLRIWLWAIALGFVPCYSKVPGGCVKATTKGIPKKQTNLKKAAFSCSSLSSCNPMNDESSFKVDCEGQIVIHNGLNPFWRSVLFYMSPSIEIVNFRKGDQSPIICYLWIYCYF